MSLGQKTENSSRTFQFCDKPWQYGKVALQSFGKKTNGDGIVWGPTGDTFWVWLDSDSLSGWKGAWDFQGPWNAGLLSCIRWEVRAQLQGRLEMQLQ